MVLPTKTRDRQRPGLKVSGVSDGKGMSREKRLVLSRLCDIHSCLFNAAVLVHASHVGLVHRHQRNEAKFEVLPSGRACGRA
jgi:hypothetical protein